MRELWNAYNENGELIRGVELVRGEELGDGIYHLVAEVVLQHETGDFLLMQRDTKKNDGGKWELTAGGSVFLDEDSIHAAIRELNEETGMNCNSITELDRVTIRENHTIYVEYYATTSMPKDAVRLQDGETIDYRWIGLEDIDKYILANIRGLDALKKMKLANNSE